MNRESAPDLTSRLELRAFLDCFYERLLADPRIAPVFADVDLEQHLPRLVDFWALMLLGEQGYRRNVYLAHVPLAIEERHFAIWLEHFEGAARAGWSGPFADRAVQKACEIASLFESKFRFEGRFR